MSVYEVRVDKRGAVALPARVRRKLAIQEGQFMTLEEQDGLLIMLPQERKATRRKTVNICDTFRSLSESVWRRLQKCSKLSMQWEETTFTDYILFNLKDQHPEEIWVYKFSRKMEAQTGADMEFWLTGPSGKWFGLRIQAKVINLSTFEYPHLYYKPSGKQPQYETLIQSSLGVYPKAVPLYLLYTYYPDAFPPYLGCQRKCRCELFRSAHSRRPRYGFKTSLGCSWIPARQVKNLAEQYERPPTGFQQLRSFMSPWHCIVCCYQFIPTDRPRDLPHRAFYWWQEVITDKDIAIDLVERPPLYVQQLLEGKIYDMQVPEERAMQALVVIAERKEKKEEPDEVPNHRWNESGSGGISSGKMAEQWPENDWWNTSGSEKLLDEELPF